MKRSLSIRFVLSFGVFLFASTVHGQDASFRRADANADRQFDLADAVSILEALFLTSEPLACQDAIDANDDGRLNVSDPILVVRHLLQGGEPPAPPFAECGGDPTADDGLSCVSHAACENDDVCLTGELLAEALGPIPGFEFCLPSGLLDIELEGFAISVCPAEGAPECGPDGIAGCPVELSGLEPFVDLEGAVVGLRLEGRVEVLPIDVPGPVGGTTTCTNDLHGSEGDTPFSFDLIVPLETEEIEPGVLEVVGTGEGTIENIDLELDSTGGLICILFQAAQDAFIDLLLQPLEAAVGSIAEQVDDAVIGLRLCPGQER